jgi:hypothetical protein
MSQTLEKPPVRPRAGNANQSSVINSRRPAHAVRQTSLLGDAAQDFDLPGL